MQAGDGEIAREISAVFRQKHIGVLHILFSSVAILSVGGTCQKWGRSILRIGGIGIDRIEGDLVFFNVRIV